MLTLLFSFIFNVESPNGIPEFWSTIFKNVDILEEMVQEHDEPILQHLEDIAVKFHEGEKMVSMILIADD